MAELNWKKILVPTDFSKTSKEALPYAIGICREMGASLTLLHVVPTLFPPDSAHLGAVMEDQRLLKEAKLFLDNFREKQIPSSITGNNLTLTGSPWHEITETARTENFDLIVVGTHGHAGLKHLWLGSTAENVVRHASCAVLTVREQPIQAFLPGQNPMRAKRILVPTDFSELSNKALHQAIALADKFDATIDLVYVIEPPPYPEFGYAHIPMKEAGLRELAEIQIAKLRAQIPALTKLLRDTMIRTGNAPYEIVETARQLNADLIVLGTHGRTGLKRLALGSTAEKVIRQAACPVLVLR